MDAADVISYLIIAYAIVVIICFSFVAWRYGEYAGSAFKAMKKRKMLLYCIPLLISVVLAIIVYPTLEEGHHSSSVVFLFMGGAFASNALFHAFEARKAKQLGPAEGQ